MYLPTHEPHALKTRSLWISVQCKYSSLAFCEYQYSEYTSLALYEYQYTVA